MFYSQSGVDEYIYKKFYGDKKNGIFIDIGAFDGIKYSTSKFFEDIGWNGICIEPNPIIFELLKKNRRCEKLNLCISKGNTSVEDFLLVMRDGPDMLSGIFRNYHPKHLERVDREIDYSGDKQILKIPTMRPNDLLENVFNKYNISELDILSIDTEGSEVEILSNIDFEKYSINIIIVEHNFNEDEIKEIVYKNNFEFVIDLGCDYIFKRLK